jgi:hypothetical protein
LEYGPPDWVPRYTLYPITVEVLGFHESATLCAPDDDCVPSPVNDCRRDESEALLAKEILPDELPVAGGVKVTA